MAEGLKRFEGGGLAGRKAGIRQVAPAYREHPLAANDIPQPAISVRNARKNRYCMRRRQLGN